MELTNQLKKIIEELYNTTPENVHSVSLGYKYINNVKTDQIGIVFQVLEKKEKSQLSTTEILPSSINIDNRTYITDVIESNISLEIDCYSRTDPQILKLRNKTFPLKGGHEIIQFPTEWTQAADKKSWGISVGTLGFFAIDNTTNKVVGITNAHVVCKDEYIATSRIKSIENTNAYNIREPILSPFDNLYYRPGAVIFYNKMIQLACPAIKRYSTIHKNLNNYLDAAVLSIDPAFINENSYMINKPDDQPEYTKHMLFATTSELDNLLVTNPNIYSVGRTTGPKGWASCILKISNIGVSVSVLKADGFTVSFIDTISFKYQNNSIHPIDSGDSGSVVFADFSGVRKIIGLAFAGSDYVAQFCRIDRLASEMNIRPWDSLYNFTNTYKSETEDIICYDFDSTEASQKTLIINGKKYYQAGCTTNSICNNIKTQNFTATALRSQGLDGAIGAIGWAIDVSFTVPWDESENYDFTDTKFYFYIAKGDAPKNLPKFNGYSPVDTRWTSRVGWEYTLQNNERNIVHSIGYIFQEPANATQQIQSFNLVVVPFNSTNTKYNGQFSNVAIIGMAPPAQYGLSPIDTYTLGYVSIYQNIIP